MLKKIYFKINLLLILTSFSICSQTIPLYVGSYTKGDSEGIYQFKFNTKTGELTERKLLIKSINPSYIAVSSNKDYIYTVCDLRNYKGTKSGAICSYKISSNGISEKISELSSHGGNPCHVSINKKEDKLVVSNYSGGTFSIYNISKKGVLETAFQIVNLNKENIKAHTHSAQFYKNNLFVADLGLNTFEHYFFNLKKYTSKKSISMVPKSGPRHFSISKNGKYVYIINEYRNTVTTLNKKGISYVKTSDISTLENDSKIKTYSADINLSRDEKFLYASNRGENTITVFKRNKKDGGLKKIQNISCHGNWPRNFTLDPTGNFLLVANQKSNNIAVFSVDTKTGELTFLDSIDSATPTCLKF